ncbi:MAG: DUF2271 domain-containing protein [Desulfonatronovibrio sp. MSAO_Bac4]|nr:MAG: DUF2271 domain-containing protein [Desulfonatronovibrio sp. MSAO_Bac4]
MIRLTRPIIMWKFILLLFFVFMPIERALSAQSLEPDSAENSPFVSLEMCMVEISFFVHVQPRMASNQFAIWIEDLDGNYVASVFATRYTAQGGYEQRPLSLPEWREVSGWDSKQAQYVDGISGATPVSGNHQVYWDCRDSKDNLVDPGRYIYKMEGNIFWENRVVWTGEVEIGQHVYKSEATPEYIPERAHRKGILLEDVRAFYKPGDSP